jgi:TonB-linked SusC/RagA family outer membrane protein
MKEKVPLSGRCIKLPFMKYLRGFTLIMLLTILSGVPVLAEKIHDPAAVITGIVTGENNQPLVGAAVKVKGSNVGTTTNEKGEFTITAADDAILVITYVGYSEKEVPVNGQTNLGIQLTVSQNQLEQVVVVGYGTQVKKNVTGAVSVVTAADMANRPIVNTGEALQGKAAGVQVTSVSGKPGASLSIRIRGSSSISAGNEPLYVVDGIPMTDIAAFSPNDIESISVLKDAASASIYGTRAANGVVVITTKKGKAGRFRVDFNTYFGTSTTTKKLDVLNGQQYQDYMGELFGGKEPPQPNPITDSLVNATNINWPDEVFRKGHQQSYQLAFSGGTDKTQYYVSLGYLDQVGTIRPASFDRMHSRLNLTSKLTNWLNITTATTFSRARSNDVTDNASVARGGVVLSALATPPTVPRYTENGQIGQNPQQGWENPLGAIEGATSNTTNDRLISNVGADIRFFKGLVFQSRFGIDYKNNGTQTFTDPWLTQGGRNSQGGLSQKTSTELSWLSEQTLTYSNRVGDHNFSALAGWSAQDSHYDETNIGGSKLDTQYRHQEWDAMFLQSDIKSPSSKLIDEWGLLSYFGRITYDFAGKYLFQGNIRLDKSSKFAPDNRSAVFPSFSAGWRISNEDFMKDVTFVEDLKLRVGWGKNGNQEGIGSYEYLSLSSISHTPNTVGPISIAPQSLTWEKTTQTNIGIDATFLNRRLSVSADFYVKKTDDVLVRIPVSGQIVSSVLFNQGAMQNIGTEFMISSKNIVSEDLNWTTDFNISFNKNKVLAIGENLSELTAFGEIYERGYAIQLKEGYPLGQFYGYVSGGVDPATGKQLYVTKDKQALPFPQTAPSDRQYIGNAQPKFVYGMTNSVNLKNFDLTVFLQGSHGNKIFNGVRVETEGLYDTRNQSTATLNRWRKTGDVTDIPGISFVGSTDNSQISSRYVEDGSYLRFKTITLSYRIKQSWLDQIHISNASVYISGQNLITITNYSGFDPEVSSYGGSSNTTDNRNVSLGVDYGAYPQAKVFLFGVNISL